MDEHRIAPRHRVLKAGSIIFGGGAIDCTVRNLSETGAALEVVTPLFNSGPLYPGGAERPAETPVPCRLAQGPADRRRLRSAALKRRQDWRSQHDTNLQPTE